MSKLPRWPVSSTASAALFGCGLTGLLLLTQRIGLVDDAYISYRYVLNLIVSHQLVFNLGERVEGATDLLWVLILAGSSRLSGVRPEWLAVGGSVCLFAFTVARSWSIASRLTGETWAALLIVAAVFFNADVFLMATNGLEGALYMALLAEAFACLIGDSGWRLGLMLGLLFMTRPEGLGVGIVLVAAHVLLADRPRGAIAAIGTWLGIVAAVTAFRLAYFRAWVPNSIVAKSFPVAWLPGVIVERSWPYLEGFARADPVLATVALAMMIGALGPARWTQLRSRSPGTPTEEHRLALVLPCAAGTVLLSVAVALRNGGDWMEHSRLLTQYAPAYALGLAAFVRGAIAIRTVSAVAFAASLALMPPATCCGVTVRLEPPGEFFAEAARRLEDVVRPGDVVSAEAAGLLPYRLMSTRIHDPTGLLDVFVARHGIPAIPYGKTDIPYTFGIVRPSFMVWHWAGHIWTADETLRVAYQGFCFRFCDDRDRAMVVLVRTDRADDEVRQAFADWTPWSLR